jgi:diguanylate cyclase (GGDEF)-like protein
VTDALSSGKQIEIRLYLHHKAGHRLPVDVKIAPMLDSTGTIIGAVQIFSDNSDKEALLERIEDLEKKAYRDYLTGLANRNYTEICLKERYEELLRYGWPFGLVFCDVDNFKAVNDQFGHDVGDKVLKMVAQALAQNTRSFDLIGRWGGDEFVALILNVDEEKFANVTERFRILVEQSEIMVGSEKINVTISVGATIAKQGESVVDLLKKTDQLMYRSKSTGGNRVNFWE